MTLKELLDCSFHELCEALRAEGINSFSAQGIRISFSSAPLLASHAPIERGLGERDPDALLPCGHRVWEGNEVGECLMGCVPPIPEEEDGE